MEQGFPSPRTAPAAGAGGLLDIISELVDGHADTVQLITGEERTELEWLAHCDYLRALQRLGRETLAHHDQRIPPPSLGLAMVAGLTSALARSWMAARVVVCGPARAVHTLPVHPIVRLLDIAPV